MSESKYKRRWLTINGLSIEELSERAGSTPFYAYDRAKIRDSVAGLRSEFTDDLQIHYAVKANPMPALVNEMTGLVDGFDVASHGEMLLALNAGMAPENISFAGPGKSDREIRAAIASGVCISVESIGEIERCKRIANELERPARICLRLNPDFELKNSGMKMTGKASQFGIDVNQITPSLIENLVPLCEWVGLHVYSGSQNLNADVLGETFQQTFALCADVQQKFGHSLEFVNLGGGFGIPYFSHERALDLSRLASVVNAELDRFRIRFPQTKPVIELGRYLVGEAGYYISRVVDVKLSRDKKFIVVDGGLHHHLANSGNFGQVIRKNYPVYLGNKIGSKEEETVEIVGPLCTPLDIVASNVLLPKVEVGDFLVVAQSGAYGASASPSQFLSHPPAKELLV